MKFLEHTLANGLEIVAECDTEAYSTAVGFFVKTGARDETDEVSGVSHFLEHMMFKGTPTRTAEDVNREFDEMGAHYNASTSEETTIYYAAVLPEYQAAAVELLADILRPSLRQEDFETEKKVIIEEIRMYNDQPPFGGFEKCMAAHFRSHPLGRSILGTVQSVTDLQVDAMREYFQCRYSPSNIALVGTGQIDFDALVATAERICDDWKRFDAPREMPTADPSFDFKVIAKESATLEYVIQVASGPAVMDADRYRAKLLGTILGDDSGSRLYWELVDPGHAEFANLSHFDFHGAGIFMVVMGCGPDRAAENIQRIINLFRQAESEGVLDDELQRAKNKISSRIVLRTERPMNRLMNVGVNWIDRRLYRNVKDELAEFEAVTLDQIAEVLAKYPLSKCTTLAIGPLVDMARPE